MAESTSSGDRELAVRTAWEVNVSPRFAADEEAYARFLTTGMRYAMPVAVIMEQMGAISGHDTSARLPALGLPTLVVHGTLDQMLPVQNGHMIAGLIPDSRLEVLDGIGHMFFLEEPERTAELVREHAAVSA